MKRLSLIAVMVLSGLVAYSVAVAQDAGKDSKKGKGRMSVEQRLEQLKTDLKLTDEQVPKVKSALEHTQKKMQELRDETDQTARREKMQGIMEEQTKKMKEILTPDQFEQWQKMRPQFGKKGGEKKAEKKSE
jgi:hypothetical protein